LFKESKFKWSIPKFKNSYFAWYDAYKIKLSFEYLISYFLFLFIARKFRRGRRQTHEWAGGDVNDFKSEEFDFQGNLDLFDKEKVFAEIRVR
jgi:hypothetical protein